MTIVAVVSLTAIGKGGLPGSVVLHHVDDETAAELFRLSRMVLEAGGRLVTSDPCFQPEQSPIARFLISRDRGRCVRSPEGYEAIARAVFDDVTVHVRHDLLRVH